MYTLERENAAMSKAQTMIRKSSTAQLLMIWEMTTTSTDENIPMVRGWLMDEFERRDEKGFEAWICGDADDYGLRKYIEA